VHRLPLLGLSYGQASSSTSARHERPRKRRQATSSTISPPIFQCRTADPGKAAPRQRQERKGTGPIEAVPRAEEQLDSARTAGGVRVPDRLRPGTGGGNIKFFSSLPARTARCVAAGASGAGEQSETGRRASSATDGRPWRWNGRPPGRDRARRDVQMRSAILRGGDAEAGGAR
jgi:hypothetical protein